MYNEFAPKHYKGKWPCTKKTLYNEKTLTGRLHKYFLIYFETFSAPTADTLFLLVLSILTLESVHSIRFLYQHFLSVITTKSLNTFYHACSYAKVDYSHFMNITAKVALRCCKCQYKNVVFLSYKNVEKTTRLYNIFCILIFLNNVGKYIFIWY